MKKLVFALVALMVGLALMELAADVISYWRRSNRAGHNASTPWLHDDDYLRYYIAPNYTGTVQKGSVTSNSLSFRGPEPQDRTHRVVCLGDSITFGWHASGDDGTYPAYLGQELADLDVDVVNGGMPRCNSMDVFDVYVTRVQPLEPDVVVVIVGWNDISYQLTRPVESLEPKALPADAFSTVQLARLAMHRVAQTDTDAVLKARESAPDEIRWRYLPVYQRVLRNFIATVRAQGSEPVLCSLAHFLKEDMTREEKERMLPHLLSWPGMSYGGWLEAVLRTNEAIREVAAELDVPLVEIENAIPSEHFTDICHLDDAGNELLAKLVAVQVREILEKQ